MGTTNGHRNGATQVDEVVDRMLARLAEGGALRDVLAQAVNDGAKMGGEVVRQQLVARINGIDIPTGNDAPAKRDRSLKGTVECPVLNCKLPGSRQLHCFCKKHFESLDREKRQELRDQQLKRKQKQKEADLEKKTAAIRGHAA